MERTKDILGLIVLAGLVYAIAYTWKKSKENQVK